MSQTKENLLQHIKFRFNFQNDLSVKAIVRFDVCLVVTQKIKYVCKVLILRITIVETLSISSSLRSNRLLPPAYAER